MRAEAAGGLAGSRARAGGSQAGSDWRAASDVRAAECVRSPACHAPARRAEARDGSLSPEAAFSE